MSITYSPTFQHEEWVDNVDRVQAAGDNGFNVRFNTIESEFQQLAQIVQQVDAALNSLGQQVGAPVTIGLTPLLSPFGANPQWSAIRWSQTSQGQPLGTFVEKPETEEQAWGVLPLALPNGVTLMDIKVLGEQTGPGDVTTEVFEESRTAPFTRTTLVTVTGLADAGTPPSPFPANVTFDGAANVYYVLVCAKQGAVASNIRLRGFQLTYR